MQTVVVPPDKKPIPLLPKELVEHARVLAKEHGPTVALFERHIVILTAIIMRTMTNVGSADAIYLSLEGAKSELADAGLNPEDVDAVIEHLRELGRERRRRSPFVVMLGDPEGEI